MAKKLKYTVQLANGSNEIIINLPVGLTIQERKLHRSCLNYKINGGYIYDSNNSVRVKFGAAPDTWPIRASIRRAKQYWLKMHKELFSHSPKSKPKWHDFKMMLCQEQEPRFDGKFIDTYNVPEDVYDDNLPHDTAGITWSLFTTEDGIGTPVVNSQGDTVGIAATDKDEYHIHLLGGHFGTNLGTIGQQFTSVSAIQSWLDSRPYPKPDYSGQELETLKNDPLTLLFNDGDADNELIDNFSQVNPDSAAPEGDAYSPYDRINPARSIMEVAAAHTTSACPVSYFTGFNALLGQVFLKVQSDGAGTMDIIFDVEPRGEEI